MRFRDLGLLGLLLAPVSASAVEVPDDWRCRKGHEARYWEGALTVAPEKGPDWGARLNDKAPTPFVWLVIYEDRDRDVAERRAPITRRWADFTPGEKCAYLGHYAPAAAAKKREYDELVGWRQDGGLAKRLPKPGSPEVMEAQESSELSEWRRRFEEALDWLESYGLEEESGDKERALNVLVFTGRLKAEFVEFQKASGHFEAQVRLAFTEALGDSELPARLQSRHRTPPEAAALLSDPAVRAAAVADIADQYAKDWRNEAIVGADFERRLAASLRSQLEKRRFAATAENLKETRAAARLRREALERAEKMVDRLEEEVRREKFSFPWTARATLLVGLEEYRQGRRRLYPLVGQGKTLDDLRGPFLELLQDVCVTHYVSLRYKHKLIERLCGKKP